ncbi:DsbA family oxidoreductase [Micromonospora zhanjiangensis]|uniref:DsbA family protein n=1 Tax=Micromonospora zhanjiangensis TaxID=1522057 RepID=A0ABV8KKG1_9ACTN
MEIEIYSDVVCPWCYIGKRRLERALASYDGTVTVRYRPFQLDPAPVDEPRPLTEAMAAKFGGAERTREIFAHTAGVAAEVGLDLRFDRAVTANTFDAHRLTWYADRRDRAAAVVEALHRAHFTDGLDVGSRDVLATLAGAAGLDPAEVRRFLDSDDGGTEVRAALSRARELGVTSVPTFVLAGKYAVTGAQEPETLLAALTEVGRRESGSAG